MPDLLKYCEERHQGDRYQLDSEEFQILLGEQLRRSQGDACQPPRMQGAQGALFMVILTSHGYTLVGKGTALAFVKDLRRSVSD